MPDNREVWPHAPPHYLETKGVFMVTGGTYGKAHHFRSPTLLDALERALLSHFAEYGWEVRAWAVFSNHYHVIAQSPEDPKSLKALVTELHSRTAIDLNKADETPGRRVWYNFWDTELTYEKSYLARLNYVNQNAVKHGLAHVPTGYPWCSARWFEGTAPPSFQRSVSSFKTDKLNVFDPFEPVAPAE